MPDALAELDEWWLGALERAAGERWGPAEELLALVAELIHAQLAAFTRVHSKPGTQPLRPLQIARPGAVSASSPTEIGRFFRGG